MDRSNANRGTTSIALVLGLLTLGLYLPVLRHPFINYDDPEYVTQNTAVQMGLTWDGVSWAFGSTHSSNWHPLTWLSHMLDAQIYGLNPAGHHFTNVLFHAANAVLLFLFLNSVTGAMWRSAGVAALFAVHPLHVESVAWVAERKDVLSGFFFFLTLWAYGRYARSPKSKVQGPKSKVQSPAPGEGQDREPAIPSSIPDPPSSILPRSGFYWLSLVLFVLGLMSKPMLVTLPFVLLLLDLWPLGRLQVENPKSQIKYLLLEKVPFFLLTLISCPVTYWAQQTGGAVISLDRLPFEVRAANALTSYLAYLVKVVWPSNLAVFYPHPDPVSQAAVVIAAVVLIAVSAYCIASVKRRPFFLAGWLWYLGTLVPVLGLVQVGIQSYADRYTYLPSIGLFVILVWGLNDLIAKAGPRNWAIAAATVGIAACLALTCNQLAYWKDTKTLFGHARDVTTRNALACTVLGEELIKEKEYDRAIPLFQEAIAYRPNYLQAGLCYGKALLEWAKFDEAERAFTDTVALAPDSAEAHFGLASALAFKRNFPDAVKEYRAAIQLNPGYWEAQLGLARAEMAAADFEDALIPLRDLVRSQPTNTQAQFTLGNCLTQLGRSSEAQRCYASTLALDPTFADKLYDSAKSMAAAGEFNGAIARLAAVLQLKPDLADAHRQLGLLLAQRDDLKSATAHFNEVLRLRPDAQAHYDLALALGIQGDSRAAIDHYRRALELNPDWPSALNDLAWLLATQPNAELRNGAEALRLAQKACELTGRNEPRFLGTLDAAYAEAGRFQEAIATAQEAKGLASKRGQKEIADAAEARLKLYESARPYRQ